MNNLFSENTTKTNLKQVRAALKANRFKEEEHARTSKVDEKLIKRYARKQTIRESAGLQPIPKRVKPTNRTYDETDDFGGLEDIWGSTTEVKSKDFDHYKTGFAKLDYRNVKAVIIPKGGQSYNPSIKDHKSLLKNLAVNEEVQVEKNLKDLKKTLPLTYGFEVEAKVK